MSFLKKITGLFNRNVGSDSGLDFSKLTETVRKSELFSGLDENRICTMMKAMEKVELPQGKDVIREGEEGDYYYLLVSGSAKVSKIGKDGNPVVVAELQAPVGFGEEALISKSARNATVSVSTPSVMLRLSKLAFDEHVKDPLVKWLSPSEAQEKIAGGARWLDVRGAEESHQAHLHGAVSIPLAELRRRVGELNFNTFYVCYCENGRISSTATFLLRQRGLNVAVLRGGLQGLKRAGLT